LHYGCIAGINVTASHNPKEYNGYKVYWEDGAQLPPEHASIVSESAAKTDIFGGVKTMDLGEAEKQGLLVMIGKECDEAFLSAVLDCRLDAENTAKYGNEIKIAYTALHGTGYKLVPEVFHRCGLKHLYTVPEQMEIDGEFPTVKKPNPEYPDVFKLGIDIAEKIGSDLIIATDPDSDRVGVMTRSRDGSFVTISGNQMGALLLDYIITAYEQTQSMPQSPYAVKTIVSTELASKICERHGIKIYNVLTGFKFIGEVIKNHELNNSGNFIFGFEESYGYLKGTYARDKDAVVSSMLICEMTAYYKAKNMTLSDALCNLYERYGYFYEANREIYHEGVQGAKKIEQLMSLLRNNPPLIFGTQRTVAIGDYLKETITDFNNGDTLPTNLPKSNVIYYKLSNGDVIIARPSGTEPKIKFYFLLQADSKEAAESNMKVYNQTLDGLIN
jgi:phosphoglucomutase